MEDDGREYDMVVWLLLLDVGAKGSKGSRVDAKLSMVSKVMY